MWVFGNALQSAIDEAEKKAKNDRQRTQARTRVLQAWLPGLTADTGFRDPSKENPDGVRR